MLPGDDTVTGDGGEYLRPEDLKELGDDSLPSSQFLDGMSYLRYSLEGGRSDRYSPSCRPGRPGGAVGGRAAPGSPRVSVPLTSQGSRPGRQTT